MSRCFPFPPPGYEKKIERSDEVMIESIKLQKERERAKKEKKREKKREKKEKKEKSRDKEKKDKKHNGEKKDEKRAQVNQKGEESEQLEKSGLTEEHGQQVSTQNLYDSSDSTQNSGKRKKPNSPTYNHGSVLRIRLPLQKHKDPEPSNNNEGPCTSGRTETPVPENASTEAALRSSFLKESSSPMELEAQQFRNLIDGWNPPQLQFEHLDHDNLEWLLEKKHQSVQPEVKRRKVSEGTPSIDGSYRKFGLVPRACHMPEADIYALPFTVPF